MPDVRVADVSVADRADRGDARGSAHIRVPAVRLRRDRRRSVQLKVVLIRQPAVERLQRGIAALFFVRALACPFRDNRFRFPVTCKS